MYLFLCIEEQDEMKHKTFSWSNLYNSSCLHSGFNTACMELIEPVKIIAFIKENSSLPVSDSKAVFQYLKSWN